MSLLPLLPLKSLNTAAIMIISNYKSYPVSILLTPSHGFSFFNIQGHHPYTGLKGPILYQCSANIFSKELDKNYVSLVGQVVSVSTTPLCSHSMEVVVENM
jgi:hypothetical protein